MLCKSRTAPISRAETTTASPSAATLLQSLSLNRANGQFSIPHVNIQDQPAASYRGLMVDVKTQWHSPDQIKQMIDMAWLYKIPYDAHRRGASGYRSVLDSTASIPQADMQRLLYTKAETQDIISYAQRGVTMVPHNESLPNQVIRDVLPTCSPMSPPMLFGRSP